MHSMISGPKASSIMSDGVLEALRGCGLFALFLIVIPVGVFTADLVKNYIKKRRKNHDKSEVHHPL